MHSTRGATQVDGALRIHAVPVVKGGHYSSWNCYKSKQFNIVMVSANALLSMIVVLYILAINGTEQPDANLFFKA